MGVPAVVMAMFVRGMVMAAMFIAVSVAAHVGTPAATDDSRLRRPSSPCACRTTLIPPDKPRPPMIAATITSGQPVPVPNTPGRSQHDGGIADDVVA